MDSLAQFAKAFELALYDWQDEAFGQATERINDRFRYRVAGVSVPRGNGKSFAAALVGVWRLVSGPAPQDILSVALDFEGAKVVLDHARRIVRSHPVLERTVEIRADALHVPRTRSRWTIASAEHTASRGRHPDLVLYDEVGWSRDDELFSSLLAGQASVEDPLMLVCSTVGRRQAGPLWTVKVLHEGGDPSVYWWHSGENLSPKVTPDFLERQRRILVPAQFAREHGNQWVDAADSFVSAEDVDRAMSTSWREQSCGRGQLDYHAFVDIGTVHDPSVIAVGHQEDGTVYVDALLTFQGSKRQPVRIETLEAALLDLANRFTTLRLVRVESWQGIALVERLQACGLPVEVFTPTPKAHAEEWPQLAQALGAARLVLFPHARLREELLNLTVEVGPTGAKVVDRGKVHQDHAVAVRGVVASLRQTGEGFVMAANLSERTTYRSPLSPMSVELELEERDRRITESLFGLGSMGRL